MARCCGCRIGASCSRVASAKNGRKFNQWHWHLFLIHFVLSSCPPCGAIGFRFGNIGSLCLYHLYLILSYVVCLGGLFKCNDSSLRTEWIHRMACKLEAAKVDVQVGLRLCQTPLKPWTAWATSPYHMLRHLRMSPRWNAWRMNWMCVNKTLVRDSRCRNSDYTIR